MWSWIARKAAVIVLSALLALFAVSVGDARTTELFFVNGSYYCLWVTLLCWLGTYLYAARDVTRDGFVAWFKENWPGVVVALIVALVAGLAIEPALRVLSDEANLAGTAKNLFASKTATFTVSGKNYYGSYWDVDVAIDRRPTLFPFLVSLLHTVRGYSYRNAFVLNELVLFAFVLLAYRLAKALRGEVFAIVSALFVAAHPVALISARSGGFDLLSAFFGLLVVQSLLDYSRTPTPATLAISWMNLCMFTEVRYEAALFLPPVLGVLLLFRMLTPKEPTAGPTTTGQVIGSALTPYAFVYALTPIFLMPRIWQWILRGAIPEQDPGAVSFSLEHVGPNLADYFGPILSILSPAQAPPLHAALLVVLGTIGSLLWLRWLLARLRARDWRAPETKFGVLVTVWMLLQSAILFSYVWGRAQYPSAARLFMPVDTFLSFAAAWVVTASTARWRAFTAVLPAAAIFASQAPVAAQHRSFNRLTQTRENAATWSFFERLGEKRILIVTDRPNHFTIMDYGAMNFQSARQDPYLFTALSRHLFYDIYAIQQIKLSTNQPLPGYELWSDRKLETMLEFQNDADVLVRISRVVH